MSRKMDALRKVEKAINKNPTLQNQIFSMPPPPNIKQLDDALEVMSKNRSLSHRELYAMFPLNRPQIDAFKKFEHDVFAEIPFHHGTYSKETCELVNSKFRDMVAHMEYTFKPLGELVDQMEAEAQYVVEKLMFLHEEKVEAALLEHPDWAEEIRRRIYNLEYYPPFKGTALEEIYG